MPARYAIDLVLLNACEGAGASSMDIFSGTAGTLIRRGIPAVVVMQYEITDRAAVRSTTRSMIFAVRRAAATSPRHGKISSVFVW